ncbi:efflux RND transporter periplasmic adaptor subunit [Uliginosibacterium gangwonense]|uniref:efflux RND transporter periplasmic adaptor subunit n=1 Tax=Uliginosibacterium gangwonense TaxID=392736 RepID=UPI0003A44E64|nr:efflux RND transporter periplasmic adaptor subunit [Uliginosibacterium gangwonense]
MSQDTLAALKIDRNSLPPPRKPWVSARIWIFGLAILVLLGAGFVLQRNRPQEVSTTLAARAWPAQGLTQVNASGYVVAATKASVASKATGRLEWLGVSEGSSVKAGQIIARIENSDIRAQLAQAAANVEAARARVQQAQAEVVDADFNLKRQQDLKAQGFVAQASVDSAQNRARQARAAQAAQEAAVRAAQAAVTELKVSYDNTLIRAPFSGVVLTKQADVGDVVTPLNAAANSKGAVVTMADLDTLEIEADVSETSLAKAHLKQAVEIQFDALPDLRLVGHVARIVPTVDRSKASVKFKIQFDEHDERALPDMSVKIAFLERALKPDERSPRIGINPQAVRDGQVFVLADGITHQRPVKLGAKLGDLIEVISGVAVGDVLVLKPDAHLKDGAKAVEKKQ